jgi:hypothetical protein
MMMTTEEVEVSNIKMDIQDITKGGAEESNI